MDSDYYIEFENKFRGDREKILNLFSSYEPLIEIAIEGKVSPILIDIGCGRGEWLQKCENKFYKSIGIESDEDMVRICKDYGLSVIEGDAIHQLSKFDNDSISVITIFHMIEHLEYTKLQKLINECQRILSDDGILVMETPSIDNLIVSTKTFYIDHTHVNPIHPDAMAFYLENAGFSNVKYFFINGGPLQDAYPLKITRILNGVAQDLCIIATKTEAQFNKIFTDNKSWQSYLNHGLTLFDAAIEFDLKLESLIESSQTLRLKNQSNKELLLLREEINLLKSEMNLLKSNLRILIYLYKSLKKIKKLFVLFLNFVRKILALTFNRIFNILLNIAIIKNFLISEKFYLIVKAFLKILGNSSNSKIFKIHNKLKKIIDSNRKFTHYNQKLLFHFEQSNKSREYLEFLNRKHK